MSIGDIPAFPWEHTRPSGAIESWPGLTYRHWLIGQALMGEIATNGNPKYMAVSAIAAADAAIKVLDEEEAKRSEEQC